MSLIGIVAYPEPSHIIATLGIAKALQVRGHQVKYFAPLDFDRFIADQEFPHVPFCEEVMPRGSYHSVGTPFTNRELGLKLFEMICKGDLDSVIDGAGLDLLAVDSYAQHIALIAYKVGLPTLLLRPTVPWSRDPWVPPVTEAIVPKSWISSLRIRASWWKYDLHKTYSRLRGSRQGEFINAIAASANYPLNEIDYGGLYPSLRLIPELILCPEEFDLPRFKIENQVHYVGAYTDLQRKDGTEFPWERIDPDKPLIYCSLGSLSHRFKEARTLLGVVIDAVTRRYDVQLVLSIGTHLDIEDFNVGAPNVILVNQAPQIAILERADIMITHGGFNSVKECIMLEVPMIVFPWGKPVNGVRVVYHGLGLMNNVRYVSVAHMQKMIDSILETPSFRMRTKAMRKTFVDTDRANLGVKAVELAISASSTDVLREQRLQ